MEHDIHVGRIVFTSWKVINCIVFHQVK